MEKSFNKMIDDLKHSIDVISEKEAREQKIRFGLLVSQIDPHFIYNTINSVNYLARKERYQDIVKVNSALCSILKDRLRVNDIQIADTIAKRNRYCKSVYYNRKIHVWRKFGGAVGCRCRIAGETDS